MLVFRKGQWTEIEMPEYVDPSWGFGDRQKAASIICDALIRGIPFEEAWDMAEKEIYISLGVLRKEHRAPENKKEEGGVKEKS